MSKPWANTGLSDFNSWWPTEKGRGLVYRGDGDMEVMNNHHQITLVEFKNAGENLSRAQLAWLQVRAKQDSTEVRVVREMPGTDPKDNSRNVIVWNPLDKWAEREVWPLQVFREWAESRAYTLPAKA